MPDAPSPGLRDQIAAALRATDGLLADNAERYVTQVADAVLPVVTAAQAAAWEFGARQGSSYGYLTRTAEDAARGWHVPGRALTVDIPVWPANPYRTPAPESPGGQ